MKNKNEKITTPIGTAIWPKLNKPETKFNKDGVYEVKLRLNAEDSKGVMDSIGAVLNAHIAEMEGSKPKMAPLPYKEVMDDKGNPTGEFDFKFKMKAVGGYGDEKWTQRPTLFDSELKPMTEEIGGGSKIQVGAELVPYYTAAIGAGVSLRLKVVKVFELVSFSRGGADQWEFSEGGDFVTEGSEMASEGVTPSDEFDF